MSNGNCTLTRKNFETLLIPLMMFFHMRVDKLSKKKLPKYVRRSLGPPRFSHLYRKLSSTLTMGAFACTLRYMGRCKITIVNRK